jgi:L-amino acid N-acyltransferase YncA
MTVRVADDGDGEVIAAIYAPYVLETAISFEELPPSGEEMAKRIAETLPTHPFLVFEENGAVLGYAYAGFHGARAAYRWSANVSAYVAIDAHRQGIGRALYTELFEHLRRQGFHSLFAGITLPNENSIGLHEAMGFTHLGTYREVGYKLGRWHDVGYWRLGLRNSDTHPSDLRHWRSVQDCTGPGSVRRAGRHGGRRSRTREG